MVLICRLYGGKLIFKAALLASLLCLLAYASGCGTTRETALDRQYQRIVERQQLKQDAFDESDIEAKLPPANNPQAFERMGDTYLKTGNVAMACVEYSKAIRLNQDNLSLRHKIAQCMLRQKMWGQAIEELNYILHKAPGDSKATQGKAIALMHLNRFKDAEAVLKSAVDGDSAMWQAHAMLGMVYDRQNQHLFAVGAYEKAVAINPKAPELYEKLGRSLYKAKQYRDSASALLKAITLNASDGKVYNALGFALFKAGLEAEAFDAFKKGGDEADACKNMGMLHMEKMEYARSIDYFTKAIDLKPTYYEAAQKGLKQAQTALDNTGTTVSPVRAGARDRVSLR